MASANCGVGRELPDTVAVMQRELWQRTTAAHVPQMLMIVGPLSKGDSFNSRRTDGRLQGRLFRRQSRDQIHQPVARKGPRETSLRRNSK